jgi:hypothetical protein
MAASTAPGSTAPASTGPASTAPACPRLALAGRGHSPEARGDRDVQ